MTTQKIILIYFVLTFLFSSCGTANYIFPNDMQFEDNSVRFGKLANGFTYYIKSLPVPNSKVYFDLHNKAGGNQEENDQLDFSHAVEHLAFKATENFPLGIRDSKTVEQMDMSLFYSSAYNSMNGTTYFFEAQRENQEAINFGLLWFKDLASGLKLSEEDINQVRGELRQEFLLRNGDSKENLTMGQMISQLFPCSKNNSHYLDFHKSYDPASLKQFYKDWYRPDLLGVSVIGNIPDLDEMENRLITTFSSLKTTENPRQLRDCNSEYLNSPPQFTMVERATDSLGSNFKEFVEFNFFFRHPEISKNNSPGFQEKQLLKIKMLSDIISQRLREQTNSYLSFEAYSNEGYLGWPAMVVAVTVAQGQEKEQVQRTFEIIQQIKKYGITETEWQKLKIQRLQYLEGEDETDPRIWKKRFGDFFKNEKIFLGSNQEILAPWLTNLSHLSFNEFIQEYLTKGPEDIGIFAPSTKKVDSYTDREVRSWIKNVNFESLKPYILPTMPTSVMTDGQIHELQEKPFQDLGTAESGAREIILENGIKVVLYPFLSSTESQRNRVYLHGFSLRGAKCFSEEFFSSAVNAPSMVSHSGINGMDKFELDSYLSEKELSPGKPYIDSQEFGIQADGDKEDMELMLQLVFLHFTRPNKDKIAFEDWKINEFKKHKNPNYNLIKRDFANYIKEITGNNSMNRNVFGNRILSGTARFDMVEKTNFEIANKLYQNLFGSVEDMTFLIYGDFEPTSILPLIQKYLANLPNDKVSEECNPAPVEGNLPEGPLSHNIPGPDDYQLKNKIYEIRFIEEAEDPDDWREKLLVQALAGVANQKVWALRYEKGYSLYQVGVAGKFNDDMNRFEISSNFECEPEEFRDIQQEVKQIINELKDGIISEAEFQNGLQRFLRLNSKERNNRFSVQERLYTHYRFGRPWVTPEKTEDFANSITIEDIVATANKYLKEENLYEFIMEN